MDDVVVFSYYMNLRMSVMPLEELRKRLADNYWGPHEIHTNAKEFCKLVNSEDCDDSMHLFFVSKGLNYCELGF